MNLLIVEDDVSVREMLVQTAESLSRRAGLEVEILDAYCLELAIRRIEKADAVLSDGTFFTNIGDCVREYHPRENWPVIAGHAARRKICFVLLSGDPRSVAKAKTAGHIAFAKPDGIADAIHTVLGALSLRQSERVAPGFSPADAALQGGAIVDNPAVAEMDAANREAGGDEEEVRNGKRKRNA